MKLKMSYAESQKTEHFWCELDGPMNMTPILLSLLLRSGTEKVE